MALGSASNEPGHGVRDIALCLLLASALRGAVLVAVHDPLASDALGYVKIATEIATHGRVLGMNDTVAFMSPGFPFVLAPAFAVFGAKVAVARAVAFLLSLAGVVLTYALARAVSARAPIPLIAAGMMALYLPGAATVQMVLKEPLTTDLMLGFSLACVRVTRSRGPLVPAALAGICYGALLIAGPSAVLVIAALPIAFAMRSERRSLYQSLAGCAVAAVAAIIIVAPWFAYTAHVLGRPVLTTNSAFNLYIGNNPAATGRFVSIAKTPLGPRWPQLMRMGEIARSDRLQAAATGWIEANPVRAAALGVRKLAAFYDPQFPNVHSAARVGVAAIGRWLSPIETLILFALAAIGLWRWRDWPRAMRLLPAIFVLFWVTHTAAYIIVRYRDPVMPLLFIAASLPIADWLGRLRARSYSSPTASGSAA